MIQKDTCNPMVTEALFTIAKTWEQPKCPSTGEWTEERISELEDKMVGINSEDQDKVKRMKKKLRTVLKTSGAISKARTFKL